MEIVLVTGASGFVGSAVLHLLIVKGWAVRGAYRHGVPSILPAGVHGIVTGDLDAEQDWSVALEGVSTVVHTAARVHMMQDAASDSLTEYRRVNVKGTLNLAHQAGAAGVKRFVFLSSVKVNGEFTSGGRRFRADDVSAPEDSYGLSKLEAEQGLMALARETGMEVVIIRSPLVYGPGVKGNFASMVRWVQKGIPLPLGAVHNQRSLLALENLVDFIALCADPERSQRAVNEIFLVSDGEDVSTTELLRRVARAYGVETRLLPVPAHYIHAAATILGKGAVADRLLGSLVVDNAKARELLGWTPVISMDEQLQKMALYDSPV
jgi:nucleoside-diphosphate-sugar epimerase